MPYTLLDSMSHLMINWCYDKADFEAIKTKEEELGTLLPPSYRDFLLTTNGFKQISLFTGGLYPIQQIDWTKRKDPEFLEIFKKYDDILVTDEQYFIYDEKQRSEHFKVIFLNETLQVSEWIDGSAVFLNPMVKFGEEWEAWIYANCFPGARRYKSFWELVEDEYDSTVELLNKRL